jgi:Histidine kinase
MIIVLFVLLGVLGWSPGLRAQDFVIQESFRLHDGDLADWAATDLDDSAWADVRLNAVPALGGIVILRGRLQLQEKHRVANQPTAVFLAALAACELAWDGVPVGRSGQPAVTADAEIPGPIETHWMVPERLALSGEHLIALRCSAHHRHFRPSIGYYAVVIADYDALLSTVRVKSWIALSSLSGMLVVGLFALFMVFSDRRDRAFLLLGAVCLCGGSLLLAESWRSLFGYTYNWHFLRLLTITGLTALLNLGIVGFVVVRYPGRHARHAILALVVLLLVSLLPHSWDAKAIAMYAAGLGIACLWMLRAVWRHQRGSVPALLGVLVTLAVFALQPLGFADVSLYISLDFLLACLLLAHVIQLREFRLAHERTLLKSARLESELLRKHIQPHFLMNTLTALSEWIEQEPAVAVQMIDALSTEFRLLASIADHALIDLGTELALCRTHLSIMSRRCDREYLFDVDGIDMQDRVPPALFHTLVENAITHDDSAQLRVTLRLTASSQGSRVRYIFEAPGSGAAGAQLVEGTGLRYVRARLQESFGTEWSFDAAWAGTIWRTEIVVPKRT